MSAVAPWAELVELAEGELAAAREGRWDDAAASADERLRRVAVLGDPPPEARPELERLAALVDAFVALAATSRAAVLRELGALRRGGTAARGYAFAAATEPGARIDGRA